jgi:hypothetical protein
VADVPFRRTGKQAVIAIAKLDERLLVTNGYSVNVTRGGQTEPPDVGHRAISVHTQTLTDVGGDATQIDTRRPPTKDLLRDDLADVLGKRPVVINVRHAFALPGYVTARGAGYRRREEIRRALSRSAAQLGPRGGPTSASCFFCGRRRCRRPCPRRS